MVKMERTILRKIPLHSVLERAARFEYQVGKPTPLGSRTELGLVPFQGSCRLNFGGGGGVRSLYETETGPEPSLAFLSSESGALATSAWAGLQVRSLRSHRSTRH